MSRDVPPERLYSQFLCCKYFWKWYDSEKNPPTSVSQPGELIIRVHLPTTPFLPEDYRLDSRGAGEQGSRVEKFALVILQREGVIARISNSVFQIIL